MADQMHEPTPEFQRFLEWQVVTAVRRHDRFAAPSRPGGVRRHLTAVTLVVASMLVGAAGVTASARIQSNQQRTLLIEQMQGELQLAEMRVEMAQSAADQARQRADVGIASPADAAAAQRALQTATFQLQRIRLNVEEVEASGQPVQDEVTSPRVGGRDFVSERLGLDRRAAAVEAEAANTLLRDIRRRQEVGLAGEVEVHQAEAEAVRAVSVLQAVQETLALRTRFLEGGLTVEEATRQRMLLLARSELRSAEQALELASKRYSTLEAQFELGLVREVDLLEARLAMLTIRQDVTTLRNRIQMLERGGG